MENDPQMIITSNVQNVIALLEERIKREELASGTAQQLSPSASNMVRSIETRALMPVNRAPLQGATANSSQPPCSVTDAPGNDANTPKQKVLKKDETTASFIPSTICNAPTASTQNDSSRIEATNGLQSRIVPADAAVGQNTQKPATTNCPEIRKALAIFSTPPNTPATSNVVATSIARASDTPLHNVPECSQSKIAELNEENRLLKEKNQSLEKEVFSLKKESARWKVESLRLEKMVQSLKEGADSSPELQKNEKVETAVDNDVIVVCEVVNKPNNRKRRAIQVEEVSQSPLRKKAKGADTSPEMSNIQKEKTGNPERADSLDDTVSSNCSIKSFEKCSQSPPINLKERDERSVVHNPRNSETANGEQREISADKPQQFSFLTKATELQAWYSILPNMRANIPCQSSVSSSLNSGSSSFSINASGASENYEVEAILQMEKVDNMDENSKNFLVLWKDWNAASCTLESLCNLKESSDALNEFMIKEEGIRAAIESMRNEGHAPERLHLSLLSNRFNGDFPTDEEFEKYKKDHPKDEDLAIWRLKEMERSWNDVIKKAHDGAPIYLEIFFKAGFKEIPTQFVTEYSGSSEVMDILSNDDPDCTCECGQHRCRKCKRKEGKFLRMDVGPFTGFGAFGLSHYSKLCSPDSRCDQACPSRKLPVRRYPLLVTYEPVIEGMGVRAITDIPSGMVLGKYTGKAFTNDKVGKKAGRDQSYQFDIEGHAVVDARHFGNITRFFNHKCDPNIGIMKIYEGRKIAPKVVYVTIQPISKGEVLTIDYHGQYATGHPMDPRKKINKLSGSGKCLCGSPFCRGFV